MAEIKAYTDEEILIILKEMLAKILMISPEEISMNSTLVNDLGMQSIDFLDFNFRLEEAFHISLPQKNPIQRFVDRFGREHFITEDGSITSEGLSFLKLIFPEADSSKLHEGITEADIMYLVTVGTYINLVKRGLEIAQWKPQQCNKCQGADLIVIDKEKSELFENEEAPLGPVFQCQSCNAVLLPPDFDEKLLSQIK